MKECLQKKISKKINLENFNSVLKANEVEEYMSKVLRSHDEPFTSIRILSQYKLYEKYSKESTVILDASGGDEIGAGYQYYQWPWFLDLIKNKEKNPINRIKSLIKNSSKKNFKKKMSLSDLQFLLPLHFLFGQCSHATKPESVQFAREKDPRFVDKGAGDGHALLLATGKL